jgi:hypothetical protein
MIGISVWRAEHSEKLVDRRIVVSSPYLTNTGVPREERWVNCTPALPGSAVAPYQAGKNIRLLKTAFETRF